MSTTIKSIYGKTWTISTGLEDGQVAIGPDAGSDRVFDVTDLLDALKAESLLEGQADVDSDLPEVVKDNLDGWVIVDGITMSTKDGADWNRRMGRNHLALAEHLEAEEAAASKAKEAEEAKAHALKCRRDDLTNQLIYPDAWQVHDRKYATASAFVKRAVDQIIELEDKLANAS